jgi:hypothetical protein
MSVVVDANQCSIDMELHGSPYYVKVTPMHLPAMTKATVSTDTHALVLLLCEATDTEIETMTNRSRTL